MLRSGELTTTEKQYVCLYLKLKLHRNIVDNIFFIILYCILSVENIEEIIVRTC
jgi:hypothetical protein